MEEFSFLSGYVYDEEDATSQAWHLQPFSNSARLRQTTQKF